MTPHAAIASIRFGLGRRPEEAAPAAPAAWLAAQLAAPPAPAPGMPDLAAIAAALEADRQDVVAMRQAVAAPPPAQTMLTPLGLHGRRLAQAEARFQAELLLTTATPFRERLVSFWANHFAIGARRGVVIAAHAGHFVREAIRPHIAGPFSRMLEAAVLHPAMLAYLDNQLSTGPNSPVGLRRGLGLNENLAREVLELHTLSPEGGYSQADVTEFARILTGWQLRPLRVPGGGAWFNPNRHEPGDRVLLGRGFVAGEGAAPAALAFLANHPATHRHLARKLVRHFVADTPPPGAIRQVEAALRDSGGDLGAATSALIALPEVWASPLGKLRSPQDYVVAVLRAVGQVATGDATLRIMGFLGQPLWAPPAPDGWPDTAPAWTGPEAMLRRVEWAHGVAGRHASRIDAAALAEAVLGPLLADATRREVARAGSRRDALTLLLTSPEFQRR